jgi:hypothetical protein
MVTAPLIPRRDVELPRRMMGLPRDDRGWIVPWFVDWREGQPVFPAFDPHKFRRAVKRDHRLCWVCGEKLGRTLVFVIGPMCAINRVTSEPPCHRDCAEYSMQVCPFLANPRMGRVPESKIFGGAIVEPGGKMDPRNPGVMIEWPTQDYRIFQTPTGPLIQFEAPTARVVWWTLGREATGQEAADAFVAGGQKLLATASTEGDSAIVELARLMTIARKTLPDPDLVRQVEG